MIQRLIVIIIYFLSTAIILSSCRDVISDAPDQNQSATPKEKINIDTTNIPQDETIIVENPIQDELNFYSELNQVILKDMIITSFVFLQDYKNLDHLIIINCTIPDGIFLVQLDILKRLEVYDLVGQDECAFINGSLPLPNLEGLLINNGGRLSRDVLVNIPSLNDITVKTSNPIEIITMNNQITSLTVSTDVNDEDDMMLSLIGLEQFYNLEYLTIYSELDDLSPLSSCYNLKMIEIVASSRVKSLSPLIGLPNLETIGMKWKAYDLLPSEEKEHFTTVTQNEADKPMIWFSS